MKEFTELQNTMVFELRSHVFMYKLPFRPNCNRLLGENLYQSKVAFSVLVFCMTMTKINYQRYLLVYSDNLAGNKKIVNFFVLLSFK